MRRIRNASPPMCESKYLLIAACAFAIGLSPVPAFAARALEPLPLAESLHIREVGNRFRLSPDGRLVAYSVRDWSKRVLFEGIYGSGGLEGQDLWISDTNTGAATNLTNGQGSSWGPVWSPDGGHIAFISEQNGQQQLWVWDRVSGRTRRVSDTPVRQYANLWQFPSWNYVQWTPDGRHVLVKLMPEGVTNAQLESYIREPHDSLSPSPLGDSAVTVYTGGPAKDAAASRVSTPVQNYRQKVYLGDIGLIDIETGGVRRLARRVQATRYELSPDASHVALLHASGSAGQYDLIVTRVDTAKPVTLVSGIRQDLYGMSMAWTPDSRSITYLDGGRDEASLRLIARDAHPGAQAQILLTVPRDVITTERALPTWDSSGSHAYLAAGDRLQRVARADGGAETVVTTPQKQVVRLIGPIGSATTVSGSESKNHVLFAEVRDYGTKRRSVYRLEPDTGRFEELEPSAKDEGEHTVARQTAAVTRRAVVYAYMDAQQMTDLWVVRPGGARRRLTHTNPVFDKFVLGEPRIIDWISNDGIRRHGAILLPAGYQPGRRYPMIVWVNGANLGSEQLAEFGFGGFLNNAHLLATRGYAVLFPDSTVSPPAPMRDIAANVLPGVDRAIELGIADQDRLGVIGHSYGGYSSLALITQTRRFRAAVSSAGLANLSSAHGRMDANGVGELVGGTLRMGGTPWEYRERYIENSPFFYLDRVVTPLLLLCGDQDELLSQSNEVFVGLRQLNKTVEYAKYHGAGHTVVYYPARLDYWQRIIDWFDRYLRSSIPAPG